MMLMLTEVKQKIYVKQREVTDDLVLAEMKKQKETTVPGAVKVPTPAPAKPVPKYGLRGRLAEPKVEPKKPAVKRPGVAGKENLPQRSKPVSKVGGQRLKVPMSCINKAKFI